MGHAYPERVSKHINKMLVAAWTAQKHVTITEIMASLSTHSIKLSTSEKLYDPSDEDDWPTVCHVVEQMMGMLRSEGQVDARPANAEQKRILKEWERGEIGEWDCGNDGKGGQYGVFDSIPWRPLKRRYWVIRSLEN